MGEDLVVDIVNQAYGNLIDRNVQDLIGKPLFTIITRPRRISRPIIDGVRKNGQPLFLYEHPQYSFRKEKKNEAS